MSFDPGKRAALARVKRYFSPHRNGVIVAIAAFVLSSLTEPLIPKLLQIALDDGFVAQPSFPLWMVPVALIGLFLVRGVFTFAGSYMLSRTTSRAVEDMRRDLAGALLRADASVYSRFTPGLAVSKIVSDPLNIANQFSGAMITLLRDGTTALALLGYLFWVNWQLTALSLVVLPVLAVSVRAVHKRFLRVKNANYQAQTRLVAVVDDIARSWRVIRTFGAVPFERQRFDAGAKEVQRTTMKAAATSALMTPLSQTIASVGVALIVTLAMYQGRSGAATVGSFAAYVAALLLLVSRTRHLTDLSQPIVGALVVARGCFELLDVPEEPDEGNAGHEHARGEIVLDGLTVRYANAEQPALDGASLQVAPGSTVALVGSSGAGKTTIVNTLLGFVAPTAGRIELDGVAVPEWRKALLRRQFAVVSQDIVLFDASIADNVVYAAPFDAARLEECLRAAALWELVQSLPRGVDEPIGVNGALLSGGQRQRLAIARALYKDAPIWIFDEATSALDTESERAIQQALERWHGRKTMILIAHRLSTVRHADAIYVLDEGRVVESGSHDELMARRGRYARSVALQGAGQAETVDGSREG
jgi:ATP-binding cassette, subfamily B, bacterial MsbA